MATNLAFPRFHRKTLNPEMKNNRSHNQNLREKMFDQIPFDIQAEIIKKVLPIKSLIRFRCVSKQWKSLIESSKFIIDHHVNHTQPHHLLVRHKVDKYVSIIDDDSFPRQKFSHVVPNGNSFPHHKFSSPFSKNFYMFGCSHGLVCLLAPPSVLLWNPSIRRYVDIPLSYKPYAFGFGVCPKTFDAKMVKITCLSKTRYEAEVFTLRVGAWRSISLNMPIKPLWFTIPEVVDGVIYWVASNTIMIIDEERFEHRIISFDLTNEEFGEVNLPDSFASHVNFSISKLKESLVVLDYQESDYGTYCDVWRMLGNGTSELYSFTKLFTVRVLPYGIIGFRMNGQAIVDQLDEELHVYEPNSTHMYGIGIYGSLFHMTSYSESLLLLDHYDSIII